MITAATIPPPYPNSAEHRLFPWFSEKRPVLVVHGNISTGTFVREHIGTKVNRPKNTSFQIRQPESDARRSIPGNDYSPSQKEREAVALFPRPQ